MIEIIICVLIGIIILVGLFFGYCLYKFSNRGPHLGLCDMKKEDVCKKILEMSKKDQEVRRSAY